MMYIMKEDINLQVFLQGYMSWKQKELEKIHARKDCKPIHDYEDYGWAEEEGDRGYNFVNKLNVSRVISESLNDFMHKCAKEGDPVNIEKNKWCKDLACAASQQLFLRLNEAQVDMLNMCLNKANQLKGGKSSYVSKKRYNGGYKKFNFLYVHVCEYDNDHKIIACLNRQQYGMFKRWLSDPKYMTAIIAEKDKWFKSQGSDYCCYMTKNENTLFKKQRKSRYRGRDNFDRIEKIEECRNIIKLCHEYDDLYVKMAALQEREEFSEAESVQEDMNRIHEKLHPLMDELDTSYVSDLVNEMEDEIERISAWFEENNVEIPPTVVDDYICHEWGPWTGPNPWDYDKYDKKDKEVKDEFDVVDGVLRIRRL